MDLKIKVLVDQKMGIIDLSLINFLLIKQKVRNLKQLQSIIKQLSLKNKCNKISNRQNFLH